VPTHASIVCGIAGVGEFGEFNNWNYLPEIVVEAPSLNSFKKQLDDHYTDMGLL